MPQVHEIRRKRDGGGGNLRHGTMSSRRVQPSGDRKFNYATRNLILDS